MEIIAATGWTWEYIGQTVTLPRLLRMQEYWKQNPPTHRLCKFIAQAVGVKFTEHVAGKPEFDNAELFGMLNAAKQAGKSSVTI